MTDRCDGCGTEISIAGGIATIWSSAATKTGGMVLELVDGTEHRLCFECIEALPDEATAEDVEGLMARDRD